MEPHYLLLMIPIFVYFLFCLLRKNRSSLRNPFLYTLTLICLVLALARPQLGQATTEAKPFTGNLYLAVDISQSMLAEDIAPTRLDFATVFSERVIKNLPQIKVALFPFTVSGFVQIPLTNDSLTVIESLGTLNPQIVTEQGTDLTLSLEKLFEKIVRTETEATEKSALSSSTSVLLLSDGESHHPLDESVLEKFAKKHILTL
jgi:Ca-activated chloride channel family protein